MAGVGRGGGKEEENAGIGGGGYAAGRWRESVGAPGPFRLEYDFLTTISAGRWEVGIEGVGGYRRVWGGLRGM